MSDIVDRLRYAGSEPELSAAAEEAADEIERLRAENAELLTFALQNGYVFPSERRALEQK